MEDKPRPVLNPVTLWRAIRNYTAGVRDGNADQTLRAMQDIEDHVADWNWAYEEASRFGKMHLDEVRKREARMADVKKVAQWYKALPQKQQWRRLSQLEIVVEELHHELAEHITCARLEKMLEFVFETSDEAWHLLGNAWDEWEFKATDKTDKEVV